MPDKKKARQTDQSKRFNRAVQELIDAGELSPTDAEGRFEAALEKISGRRDKKEQSGGA